MTLENFEPVNDLETNILEARHGALAIDQLLTEMAASALFISSKNEVLKDGSGFDPLLFKQGGKSLVAVFSSLQRPDLHQDAAQYILQMNGREFFLRLPPIYGVIINPGFKTQLVVTPEAVADLQKQLRD